MNIWAKSTKRSASGTIFRLPLLLLFLGFTFISCGGGGGGGGGGAPNSPPAVTTDNASSVTLNGATLNGTVNPRGLATDAWFKYGTDPGLASFTTTQRQSLGAGTAPLAINEAISSLSPGVTYYFRAVAENIDGTAEGAIRSFSTLNPPPTAVTSAATGITNTGGTLRGTVNPNGIATEAWFEYGQDPTLTSRSTTARQPVGSGTVAQPVSATLTTLIPWRTYYFRVVAESPAGGPVRGAILSFPTGEYYVAVGDSITRGSGDDGFPPVGFEPRLQSLLTATNGYPHNVINEGVSGHTAIDGRDRMDGVLAFYPDAMYYLVMYGTNDAAVPIPSGLGLSPGDPGYNNTYKDYMKQIIDKVYGQGMIPYLAKIPYTLEPARNAVIQQYNLVIEELVSENAIPVTPPDFYTWFQTHPGELADALHPNDTGYQSMANLWHDALTQ